MPPDLHDAAYLHDMLLSARIAVEFAKSRSRTELVTDLMFGDAVIRRLEIVGEASRNVSQTFRDAHSEIPWRAIMATRHILAHEYDGVDYDTVWRIVKEHLPLLINQLDELLKEIPPPDA